MGLPCGSDGEESACNVGELGLIPRLGRPLVKEMATHSSILAWEIPWTEEPGWATVYRVAKSNMAEQLTLSLSLHIYYIYNIKYMT